MWRYRSGVCFAPSRRTRKRSPGGQGNQVWMEVRPCYRVLNLIFLNDLLGLTSTSMTRRAACCPLRQRGCRSSDCPVQRQNSHRVQESEKKYRSWNYPFWRSPAGCENRSKSIRKPAQTGGTEGARQYSKIFADCGRKFQTVGQRRGRKPALQGGAIRWRRDCFRIRRYPGAACEVHIFTIDLWLGPLPRLGRSLRGMEGGAGEKLLNFDWIIDM